MTTWVWMPVPAHLWTRRSRTHGPTGLLVLGQGRAGTGIVS